MIDSSKWSAQGLVHGGQGIFLASVSAMSLISITSHHHLHRSHNTLTMHKSEVISRQAPAPAHHHLPYFNHGTRVTLRDMFGSMPVRVRQRAITAEKQGGFSKDWEGLKRSVVILLLAWPRKVAVTVREVETGHKMIIRPLPNNSLAEPDVSNVCNTLAQASLITPAEISSWVSVGASTSKLKIDGAISLDPVATKSVQFISFGIRPLATDEQGIIHEEINRIFSNSAFGNEEDDGPDFEITDIFRRSQDARYDENGFTYRELKGKRKAVDRWPMFYINIQQIGTLEHLDMDEILDNNGNSLNAVIELLKTMILRFLENQHFQPKATGRLLRHKESSTSSETMDQRFQKHYKPGSHGSHIPGAISLRTKKVEKKGTKGSMKNSDFLGTNIKLPSFSQTDLRPGSPFEAWSRIKSGIVPSKVEARGHLVKITSSEASKLERPSTAPLPSANQHLPFLMRASTPDLARTDSKRQAALLSPTGRISRPPFEDILFLDSQPRSSRSKHAASKEQQSDGDYLVPWMNPITKVTSLVNKRTGLVVSRTTESSQRNNPRLSFCKTPRPQLPLISEPSPWLSSVLESWDNPVFQPTEVAIPKVSLDNPDCSTNMQTPFQGHLHGCTPLDVEKMFNESIVGISGRISKDALRNAEVISQVDKKFILVKLHLSEDAEGNWADVQGRTLVIVDQHAVDERVRIEDLMQELCMPPLTNLPSESGIRSIRLEKPLSYTVSSKEIQLLRTHKRHFADWGILYDLLASSVNTEHDGNETQRVIVASLPPGIVERCKANPRLLIELMRTEVWKIHDQGIRPQAAPNHSADDKHSWVAKIRTCPQGIIDMLNSRACRSAVMFNDELSHDQCKTLISRVAECSFPFQCAHGRPSLVPLVDLGLLRDYEDPNRD